MLTPHEKNELDRHIMGNSDDAFNEYKDEGTRPCEKCNGTGARYVAGEPVWQEPCGECSGEGVVCGDRVEP